MPFTPETFQAMQEGREFLLRRSNGVTNSLAKGWVEALEDLQKDLEAATKGLAGADPRASALARRASMVGTRLQPWCKVLSRTKA